MIRWGILGTGRAARRFAQSVRHLPDCQIVAVAGRDVQKTQAFADSMGRQSWPKSRRFCQVQELFPFGFGVSM